MTNRASAAPLPSVLAMPAWQRLAWMLIALAGLWTAVGWALDWSPLIGGGPQ